MVNGDDEELDKVEAKAYRGLVARLNFLDQDCPDLQFPVKQVSREMANPVRGSWKRLKKVCMYLIGREKVVWKFAYQDRQKYADVYADSDWGGRKSTVPDLPNSQYRSTSVDPTFNRIHPCRSILKNGEVGGRPSRTSPTFNIGRHR